MPDPVCGKSAALQAAINRRTVLALLHDQATLQRLIPSILEGDIGEEAHYHLTRFLAEWNGKLRDLMDGKPPGPLL